jgi:hypothetical protein
MAPGPAPRRRPARSTDHPPCAGRCWQPPAESPGALLSLLDHADVTLGTTDDGRAAFATCSPSFGRTGHTILVAYGFVRYEHDGRTVYQLPVDDSVLGQFHAMECFEAAYDGLLRWTPDIVAMNSPWFRDPDLPPRESDVRLDLSTVNVTAVARTEADAATLELYGFAPALATSTWSHALPARMSEEDKLSASVMAEAHLRSTGAAVETRFGIPALHPTAPVAQLGRSPRAPAVARVPPSALGNGARR